MLTKMDIQKVIHACRIAGDEGLGNGSRAVIPELMVDYLTPPSDFLGVGSNPAIFVNRNTYALLGRWHKHWKVDQTIAIKDCLLQELPIKIIGVIVHETGHAFNVAANIVNSEANAYIFEIEVMSCWFNTQNAMFYQSQKADIQSFFESRLPYYRMEIQHNVYLSNLVAKIEQNTLLNKLDCGLRMFEIKKATSPRFVIQTPLLVKSNPTAFFQDNLYFLVKMGQQDPAIAEEERHMAITTD